MALDEARRAQMRLGGQDRGIEALQVPDLQHAPLRLRERDQLARLARRSR